MSELRVVEQEPEVLVPMDRAKAEFLDKRIRTTAETARNNLESVGRLLDEAKAGQVHVTLGFRSWPEYVADALGGQLELSAEGRKAAVALMAGQGMSERAIAEATGASKTTVHRDIEEVVHNGPPDPAEVVHDGPPTSGAPAVSETITTLDNKTYKRKPKPKRDKPTVGRRRPDARKAIERIAPRLHDIAATLAELDPAELDGVAEVQKDIGVIVSSLLTLRGFVDKVKPARAQQVPAVFRGMVAKLGRTIPELQTLSSDPRWAKARKRFSDKDRAVLELHIAALQDLRAAMDVSAPATTDGEASPDGAVADDGAVAEQMDGRGQIAAEVVER